MATGFVPTNDQNTILKVEFHFFIFSLLLGTKRKLFSFLIRFLSFRCGICFSSTYVWALLSDSKRMNFFSVFENGDGSDGNLAQRSSSVREAQTTADSSLHVRKSSVFWLVHETAIYLSSACLPVSYLVVNPCMKIFVFNGLSFQTKWAGLREKWPNVIQHHFVYRPVEVNMYKRFNLYMQQHIFERP